MEQKKWTMQDAADKVQKWYDRLKTEIDNSNWDAVGRLYNANSLLFASKRAKAYIGSKAIKLFWKSNHLENGLFTIKILTVYPIDPPARRGRRLVREGTFWTGILVGENRDRARTEVNVVFCGGGGHIDPCDFANPDFEIYPF